MISAFYTLDHGQATERDWTVSLRDKCCSILQIKYNLLGRPWLQSISAAPIRVRDDGNDGGMRGEEKGGEGETEIET